MYINYDSKPCINIQTPAFHQSCGEPCLPSAFVHVGRHIKKLSQNWAMRFTVPVIYYHEPLSEVNARYVFEM